MVFIATSLLAAESLLPYLLVIPFIRRVNICPNACRFVSRRVAMRRRLSQRRPVVAYLESFWTYVVRPVSVVDTFQQVNDLFGKFLDLVLPASVFVSS